MLYTGDVVAAISEDGTPLRAEIRDVLRTKAGKAVLNLAGAWGGKRVVIVELPEEHHGRRSG